MQQDKKKRRNFTGGLPYELPELCKKTARAELVFLE